MAISPYGPSSAVGIIASASFTPAAAAYTAGDILGVAQQFAFTFANGNEVPTGALIRITGSILKIDHTDLVSSEGAYTLQLYNVTPPSARADNAAWTVATGDLAAYVGSIALGTPVDVGQLFVRATPSLDIKLASTSLWGELTNAGTMTPTAVARQVTLIGVVL